MLDKFRALDSSLQAAKARRRVLKEKRMTNYWQKALRQRLSRRRALAATGAAAAGAALLAACGGDGDGGSAASRDKSGLLSKIEDTSKSAKPGGIWPSSVAAELQTLDPNRTTSGSALAPYGYSRLFTYRPGVAPELSVGATDPDAAESSELSPDGLRLTIKLRPDLKLDARPPTSGRNMDANDVKYSWDAFAASNSSRGELINSLSPTAPVDSLQALDNRTIAFKLVYPVANTLILFAFQRYMWLLPVEADGKFDARNEMRGTGPWRLMKWETSIGYTLEKNPAWHMKGLPYLDGIDLKVLSEYSARRAQLLAGNQWTTAINPEDVVSVKREQPKLSMYTTPFPEARRALIGFNYRDGSPFHDVRVRRAVSMLLDRDPWIDAFYNVSEYAKDGLEVDARWDSHYMGGDAPYWIDPKGAGLGEGAAFFKHNPAEATKLVRAAGFNQAIKLPGFQSGTPTRQVQVIQAMLNEGGLFDISLAGVPAAEWDQRYHHGQGMHEGIALSQSTGQAGDIDAHISVRYNVGNGTRVMLPRVFPWYQKTQSLIEAQRKELDQKKRSSILEELQKEFALQMPTVPHPGAASGFAVAWPLLANFGILNPRTTITSPTEVFPKYWYDASKKA
jgi:ABC-type transport system substrate-binding protein